MTMPSNAGPATVAALLACCALLLGAFAPGAARADTAGVVVGGLGGEAGYAASFAEDAATVAEALRSLGPDPDAIELLAAGADRETVLAAIERLGAREADTFALVLIGHGTAAGKRWAFNLPGPDLGGEALVAALATVRAPRQLIVLGASASGALLETLAQPGRVVVTATKSGGEINAVRFPGFFADALGSEVADLDRNEILTVAEAFRFADARTREHYEEAKLLAPEHARIDGDEAVSMAVARLGSLRLAGDDPEVAALLGTRLSLERDYHALRAGKDDMASADYYAELETLMLALARLQQAIDRVSGWSGDDAES